MVQKIVRNVLPGVPKCVPPLSRHCPATVPPLSRHCPASVPPLSRHCPATVPPLSRHCPATFGLALAVQPARQHNRSDFKESLSYYRFPRGLRADMHEKHKSNHRISRNKILHQLNMARIHTCRAQRTSTPQTWGGTHRMRG
jgi:hypothetical protein